MLSTHCALGFYLIFVEKAIDYVRTNIVSVELSFNIEPSSKGKIHVSVSVCPLLFCFLNDTIIKICIHLNSRSCIFRIPFDIRLHFCWMYLYYTAHRAPHRNKQSISFSIPFSQSIQFIFV